MTLTIKLRRWHLIAAAMVVFVAAGFVGHSYWQERQAQCAKFYTVPGWLPSKGITCITATTDPETGMTIATGFSPNPEDHGAPPPD